jgi:hypothetical protein
MRGVFAFVLGLLVVGFGLIEFVLDAFGLVIVVRAAGSDPAGAGDRDRRKSRQQSPIDTDAALGDGGFVVAAAFPRFHRTGGRQHRFAAGRIATADARCIHYYDDHKGPKGSRGSKQGLSVHYTLPVG